MILPFLWVGPSDKGGNGVFTSEDIIAGTVIEISPVLVFSAEERVWLEKTLLYNYIFEWGEKAAHAAVGLGYISLYNHSYHSNCDYDMDFTYSLMKITTVRNIRKGEELFINYNASPDNGKKVWFDAV